MNKLVGQVRLVKAVSVSVVALVLAGQAIPVQAQDTLAESRLRKMEAEIRAMQRVVFPGTDGKVFSPQIAQQGTSTTTSSAVGQPATSAVTDLLTRMETLEAQIAKLTGEIEQNGHRLAQLEARAGIVAPTAAPAAAAAATGTAVAAATPTPTSTPNPTPAPVPAPQANSNAMTGGASTPKPAVVSGPSADRIKAVSAISKPQTSDPGDDEYSYGYRLWEAKFYPEAQQQLKLFADKYPKHVRISHGRNLLGRAFLDDGKPREAAQWFLQNYQADKKGARAPDSLLMLAVAMKELKDTKRSCIALAEFAETFSAEAAGRLKGTYDATAMGSSALEVLNPGGELTGRFTEALIALWPEASRGPDWKLGLAVSGGPDSTALLLLAAAAFPGKVEAATVDHGLRPESAAEAAEVAALCARLDVSHATLAVEVPAGNVQAEARRARYAALAGWIEARGLSALATAHHADDQAETLLLRLNRASGVAGLAGARARGLVPGTAIPLLRPLLDWRREVLGGVVAAAGVAAAQDPSNGDDRFDRARLRKALAGADWLDIAAVAASAAHLADADAALDWAARREWDERVVAVGLGVTYRPQAPRAVALRVLARIVTELDGEEPRGGAVARLFESLAARQPASIGNLVARPMPSGWSFTRAPKRRGG